MARSTSITIASLAFYACSISFVAAQSAETTHVDDDGTITGSLPPVPVSNFLSDDAKEQLTDRLKLTGQPSFAEGVEAARAFSDQIAKKSLDRWLEIYPADIDETSINGVAVDIVTPKAGIAPGNENRVLINAHMGGFQAGSRYGGQIESVPLAGHAGIKIYAVDYRLAPEHIYPAASEDMEVIYRHVLKTTPADNIGIYGCSAGGTLTGQMIPWFLDKGLPLPGSISIQCAGIMDSFWFGGDSGQTSGLLNGRPIQTASTSPENAPRNYFEGIDTQTRFITPGNYPEVLAQFPPTLVVTGTRDISMSNALVTHTKLLQADAHAELFVQEGLGHGHFFAFPGAPESFAAYDIIWDFFDRTLGQQPQS